MAANRLLTVKCKKMEGGLSDNKRIPAIYASIITIGDELLIGQVIDTNSAWMAQELNKAGIWLRRRISVGDSKDEIVNALNTEIKNASIVLITGGLGPTADDITKPVLAEYFGGTLIVDPGALENVQQIFKRLNHPIIERNMKQAEVPDVCTVIPNKRGTAPGMWFEKDCKIIVSMPGVPHEMQGMMTGYVIPKLRQYFTFPFIDHRTLLTAGVGESFIAEKIQVWENALPANFKLAYLPNYGMVRLRITGSDSISDRLQKQLDESFAALKTYVREWLVIDEDMPLAKVVGELLKERNATVSAAESCTGGYIAHLITSFAGSSAYFKGSVVSYANEVKENVLHVSHHTLSTDGAVSEATVRQMVAGVMAAMNTDYAVATSGIMGPDGGTPEKPVGTVWIAAGGPNHMIVEKFHFRYNRERNIEMASIYALNMLRKCILEA